MLYLVGCNSLCLHFLGKPTGTGVYAVWETNDEGFKTESRTPGPKTEQWDEIRSKNMNQAYSKVMSHTKCKKELEWLEWTSKVVGKKAEQVQRSSVDCGCHQK